MYLNVKIKINHLKNTKKHQQCVDLTSTVMMNVSTCID